MKLLIALWLICGWLAWAPIVFAASQMESVTIGYSSFSGAYGPLWIAVEEQLGKRHGLELIVKTNKQKTVAVLKKYMRGASDDILDATYEFTKAGLEDLPTPSLEITKTALDILSHQYPQAKQTDPNPLIDPSWVRRIEQSGFMRALSEK
jgi:hypothetical protein